MPPANALATFGTHVLFEQYGPRVVARVSPYAVPQSDTASERGHRYDYLTTPLKERGLECNVEYDLSDYIVHAQLPDGSSLIISPPHDPPSEHPGLPESWIATRHRSAEPAVYEVIYDSEPDGPHARNRGSVTDLLAAVDARLDQLGIPPRPIQKRSAEERAAASVLHRAGFVSAVAVGGEPYYRLPSAMTDRAEQRRVVTRAYDMLQVEGFYPTCDPALLDSSLPLARSPETGLGDHLGDLARSIQAATHTSEAVAPLSELTTPGDGVLPRVVEILGTTADWWESLGGTADHRYARHLRNIADHIDAYTESLLAVRNDLADRHSAHPHRAPSQAARTAPTGSASPRVSAALTPSPSAGRRTVPGHPPPEPAARTVLPPALTPFAPGR